MKAIENTKRYTIIGDQPGIVISSDAAASAQALEKTLIEEGFKVLPIQECHTTGAEKAFGPDVVILDVAEHVTLGQVEKRLSECRLKWHAPILCLIPIGTSSQPDAIAKLSADDYLLKPVRVSEFINRIQVLLERHRSKKGPLLIDRRRQSRRKEDRLADVFAAERRWTVDEATKTVVLEGRSLNLSPREYDLFRLLSANPGRVLSAQEIIQQVWCDTDRATSSDVHQYMHLLRRKIGITPSSPRWIVTVRGFGYMFVVPEEY